MNIRLVVFDMAGNTVRDDDAVNTCLREALAGAHVEVNRADVNEVMGLPKPVAIRRLIERQTANGQPVSAAQVAALHDAFVQRMIHFYRTAPDLRPMPYAVEVFCQLKTAGVRVALDTGFSRPIVDAILARLDWTAGLLLDTTVTSDEVPRGRPHPDLVLKAMERTGVADPRLVAKVGDTPSDLQEGTAAGCGLVIGVANGTHTREELAAHPHTHLIGSLQELPALVLNGR